MYTNVAGRYIPKREDQDIQRRVEGAQVSWTTGLRLPVAMSSSARRSSRSKFSDAQATADVYSSYPSHSPETIASDDER